jgi:hypothetical protein
MKNVITQALNDIINIYGDISFINPIQFKNVLSDVLGNRGIVASEIKRLRNLLNIAIVEMRVHTHIKNALAKNELYIINNIIKEMEQVYDVKHESAEIVVGCIADLLGYSLSKITEPTPPIKPLPVNTLLQSTLNPSNQSSLLYSNYENIDIKIKVFGLGGYGNNFINRTMEDKKNKDRFPHTEFIAANTDRVALDNSIAPICIQLGEKLSRGLGAGGKPEWGRRCTEESIDILKNTINGANIVIIVAGMGGGTGTGAASVVADICREKGLLTIGVVTKPFLFEDTPRMNNALIGINKLRECVDAVVVIPNEKLFEIIDDDMSLSNAFRIADNVLIQILQGLNDMITTNNYHNALCTNTPLKNDCIDLVKHLLKNNNTPIEMIY